MTHPDTATKTAADVSAMFDEVSPRYDLINDVLTVGNDRLWRIATTRAIAPRKGMRILDLAAGTGTSSAAIAAHGAEVVAADFSEGMLAEGRRRHAGNPRIDFVRADATALPFEDDSFDAATISYGLRNVSDPKAALAELRRVVKPGGRVVIAEFSTPTSPVVRRPYAFYGRHVLPRVAGAINRDAAAAYRYLNESIEAWPAQDELAAWLREAGFERVAYRNLTFGIVALHRGFVPRERPVRAVAADSAEVTEPAAKQPVAAKKPAAEKPSAPRAAAEKPAAKQSAASKKPSVAKGSSVAKKPSAVKQPVDASGAEKPAPAAAGKPSTAGKPAAGKPAAGKPAAKKPAAKKPAAKKPAAKKSAAKQSAAKQPAAKQPAAPKTSAPAQKPVTANPAAREKTAAKDAGATNGEAQ